MTVKIIAFGQIAEITGKNFEAHAADTNELEGWLRKNFPALENKKFAIAVNKRIVSGIEKLNENDEVALMPPYSGG
ncbi:MAG: MoaD/ThiS family protein [Flavobacterium sp.]|nr:MAG: MoaD/ThiS family protein [Flavobacterium sp.]